MAIKTFSYYIVLFLSMLTNHGTVGVQQWLQKQLDLEKQFEVLQKPSVKTIKTEHGAIYDCVDFYKQPGFDHPLLKNHNFHPQMRSSFHSKQRKFEISSEENDAILDSIKLKDGGCPIGTVPIRRVSKIDYIEIMRYTEQYASRTKLNTNQPQAGTHLAIVQTKTNPSTTVYNGVGAEISLHNLSLASSQHSAGEMILRNENDQIKVGWMVNPTLYKDNYTHLFQYLDAGESHCFDTLCPGFISVRQDIPVGGILTKVSSYGHLGVSMMYFVYQDPKNGNWWLEIGNKGTVIGFWPKQIFTGLAHSATYVAVGGEAYGPPDQPLPAMGNGHYPIEDVTLSAFCFKFFVIDAIYKQIDTQDTEEFRDDKHYDVYDVGYVDKEWRRTVFYGGPYK